MKENNIYSELVKPKDYVIGEEPSVVKALRYLYVPDGKLVVSSWSIEKTLMKCRQVDRKKWVVSRPLYFSWFLRVKVNFRRASQKETDERVELDKTLNRRTLDE